MTDEQETNHAFARSLSNAGLGAYCDEDDELDDPYCDCGAWHDDDEVMSNRCKCCGKPLEAPNAKLTSGAHTAP